MAREEHAAPTRLPEASPVRRHCLSELSPPGVEVDTDADGQLRAEVACQPDAASIFGAIGLKVGVGVEDALYPSGNAAQQTEGAHTWARRAQHLGGQLA
eukprot:7232439-Prymnesium_polylepis.1